MNQQTMDYAKRTRQYWWIDGLAEIGFGLEMVLLVLYFVSIQRIENQALAVLAASIGMPVFFLASFYAVGKLTQYLKQRITYPRTGYVVYPRRQPTQRRKKIVVAAVIGTTTALAVNLTLAFFGAEAQWLIISLVMGMALIYFGWLAAGWRYYLLGGVTLLWGFSLRFFGIPSEDLYAWFFSGVGAIFLLSGFITLMRYLRRYPLLEEDEDA